MKCHGCDEYEEVNDIGLCDDCDDDCQVELILNKEWDYVVEAFGMTDEQKEALYQRTLKSNPKKS